MFYRIDHTRADTRDETVNSSTRPPASTRLISNAATPDPNPQWDDPPDALLVVGEEPTAGGAVPDVGAAVTVTATVALEVAVPEPSVAMAIRA